MRNTMPATSPPIPDDARATLAAVGRCVRTRREALRVSAVAAAEAAGMSRVTLHRIEHGEPSVTMGAYLSALSALGIRLEPVVAATDRTEVHRTEPDAIDTPDPDAPSIRIGDHPALRRLGWQLDESTELSPREALNLYERNWRHVDISTMDPAERDFLDHLVKSVGKGILLV
jgi:transcriptional regulator with XRE-family HTH domain